MRCRAIQPVRAGVIAYREAVVGMGHGHLHLHAGMDKDPQAWLADAHADFLQDMQLLSCSKQQTKIKYLAVGTIQ
jgi:hypothetical protein